MVVLLNIQGNLNAIQPFTPNMCRVSMNKTVSVFARVRLRLPGVNPLNQRWLAPLFWTNFCSSRLVPASELAPHACERYGLARPTIFRGGAMCRSVKGHQLQTRCSDRRELWHGAGRRVTRGARR